VGLGSDQLTKKHKPDVLLLDIRMPGTDLACRP
jgi:hypothetical protein